MPEPAPEPEPLRVRRAHELSADAARAEIMALLTLLATPGLPQRSALSLLRTHGRAEPARQSLRAACGAAVANAAAAPAVVERVRRALLAIAQSGIAVLSWTHEQYPERLRLRLGDDAPLALFALGNRALLDTPAIAVVGCRSATEYGLDIAEDLAAGIARAGGCVVSGLARGIDAAAHRGALEADGATIGVLGCGVDVYYPREHTALQDSVARHGLLLSELLPGEPPRRHNFPHRNRIIAALSEAVVVVEAGVKSGAVRTAQHALDQGVPVYGVPNALDRPTFQGVLALLADGAPVYSGVRDLLEETKLIRLGDPVRTLPDREAPPADALHGRLWQALGAGAQHADTLARAAGVAAPAALAALLELELDGRIRQLPGQRFALVRNRRPPDGYHGW